MIKKKNYYYNNSHLYLASRQCFIDLKSIPLCSDFTDLGFLLVIGYKTFLLGDDLCQNEEFLQSALGVLNIMNT